MNQREIKFRAWHKERRLMSPTRTIADIAKESEFTLKSMTYEYEWIQYIGVKDLNGKEIYEGDILNTWAGIGIVVWVDYMYMLKSPGSEAMEEMHLKEWESFEIIGNIYENPELLTSAQP